MKKNSIYLLLLVVSFDLLFYKQTPGLNASIFGLLLLAVCLIQKPELKFNKIWILVAITAFLSTVFVGVYSDFLSVSTCMISFTLLAAYTNEKNSSIGIAISGAAFTYLRSPFILFKGARLQIFRWQENRKNTNYMKAGIIGFTFLIVLIFFFIYRNSSLLFYNLTQNINLDFISFSLIFFTLNALLLITAFQKYAPIEKLHTILDKPSRNLVYKATETDEEIKKISIEQFAGILLLSSLNGLLLIVNILDLGYLINRQLPQGISYSDFIHQGVGMLILSIILAISIILYFFRRELNFSNNKWLKIFAYAWITQNLFMVLSNVSRNSMYIEAYGLTEKRIGVYFYLLLAAIGLVTTLIKIYKKQNNAYLMRSTSTVFFVILLVSCAINWDNIITRHDLARYDANTNFNYLNDLSYTNIPQMLDYVEKYKSTKDIVANKAQLENLHNRILHFLNNYNENTDWQSLSYFKRKIYNDIVNKNIDCIYLQNTNKYTFKGITYLPYVKEIVVNNSELENSSEWPKLQNLKRLTLINCGISDTKFIYHLKQLEYLDISGNDIQDYKPLYSLKNLKELHVSAISINNLKMLQIMLPHTKINY
jgi:hypothetical protein